MSSQSLVLLEVDDGCCPSALVFGQELDAVHGFDSLVSISSALPARPPFTSFAVHKLHK
jgi:hypothetical protein